MLRRAQTPHSRRRSSPNSCPTAPANVGRSGRTSSPFRVPMLRLQFQWSCDTARLLLGRLRLFEHQTGDEFTFRRRMLDVIANRKSVLSDVEHNILFDLDGSTRGQRPYLNV